MMNNTVCFGADGSMIINNGYQTIKMGNGGMSIQNTGGPQVVMNNNGMQVYSHQSSFSGYSCPAQNFVSYTTYTSHQPQFPCPYLNQLPVQQIPFNTYTYNHTVYSQGQTNQVPNVGFQNQIPAMGWQAFPNTYIPQPNIFYSNAAQPMQAPQAQSQPRGLTREQINQLPVSDYARKPAKIKKPKSKGKNEQTEESSSHNCCSICIGDYEVGEKITTLPCIHRFHKECIEKWLEVKSECPVCKYDLLS